MYMDMQELFINEKFKKEIAVGVDKPPQITGYNKVFGMQCSPGPNPTPIVLLISCPYSSKRKTGGKKIEIDEHLLNPLQCVEMFVDSFLFFVFFFLFAVALFLYHCVFVTH